MFKEEFDGKKCIVTGGAGFIGSSLVEKLISSGANVKIIDNLSVGKQNVEFLTKIGAKIVKSDICDYNEIKSEFRDVHYVFHLAAMNRAQRSINDPIKSNDINVNGTLNCLHISHLNKVKKFIFVSSSSVYKGVENEALKEGMFLEPLHPYGIGKLS